MLEQELHPGDLAPGPVSNHRATLSVISHTRQHCAGAIREKQSWWHGCQGTITQRWDLHSAGNGIESKEEGKTSRDVCEVGQCDLEVDSDIKGVQGDS